MEFIVTKSYSEAINNGNPRNIKIMYPDMWEFILDSLKAKKLIDNWSGNIANVSLSKSGKALLSTF